MGLWKTYLRSSRAREEIKKPQLVRNYTFCCLAQPWVRGFATSWGAAIPLMPLVGAQAAPDSDPSPWPAPSTSGTWGSTALTCSAGQREENKEAIWNQRVHLDWGFGPSSGVINHLVHSWPAPAVRQKLRVDDHGGNFTVYLLQSPGFNTQVMQNLPQVKPNGYWINSETCTLDPVWNFFRFNLSVHWMLLLSCWVFVLFVEFWELILRVAKECGWNTC